MLVFFIHFTNCRKQVTYPFMVVGSLSVYSIKRRKRSALNALICGCKALLPMIANSSILCASLVFYIYIYIV